MAIFFLVVDFIIGINLLRGRELARRFAIFIAGASLVFFFIFMLAIPIVGLNMRKNYEKRQILYKQLSIQLSELQKEAKAEANVAKIRKKLGQLREYIDWYATFEKSYGNIQAHYSIETGVIYFLFFGTIIYYLRKPYVRKQFE